MATCKGCGATIEWITTEAGKKMPVDPPRVVVVTFEGKVVTGQMSHFATCPKADRFRKND